IAGGRATWFGHEVDRHGPVVYMIGEDKTGIRNRLRAELDGLQIAADLPLYFTARPGNLTDPDDVATWHRAIHEVSPDGVALLVVDTQSRNFGAGNENASEDMSRFVHHCQTLADRLGALVLLVHHTGHAAKDRGRGSSVMFGALDASYEVVRTGTVTVTATANKSKNWADPAPLVGTLNVREVGLDRKGRPVTAVSLLDRPPAAEEVFDDLPDQDEVRRLVAAVEETCGALTSRAELARAAGFTGDGRPFRTLLERCLELGYVVAGDAKKGRKCAFFPGKLPDQTSSSESILE
ncbi:MAG: hypothetical protein RLZZ246_1187, partial [Planctomycetota bacterium]